MDALGISAATGTPQSQGAPHREVEIHWEWDFPISHFHWNAGTTPSAAFPDPIPYPELFNDPISVQFWHI